MQYHIPAGTMMHRNTHHNPNKWESFYSSKSVRYTDQDVIARLIRDNGWNWTCYDIQYENLLQDFTHNHAGNLIFFKLPPIGHPYRFIVALSAEVKKS